MYMKILALWCDVFTFETCECVYLSTVRGILYLNIPAILLYILEAHYIQMVSLHSIM